MRDVVGAAQQGIRQRAVTEGDDRGARRPDPTEQGEIDQDRAAEWVEQRGDRRARADLLVQHQQHDVLDGQCAGDDRCIGDDRRAGHYRQADGSRRVLLRRQDQRTTSAAMMVSGRPIAIRAVPSQPVSSPA